MIFKLKCALLAAIILPSFALQGLASGATFYQNNIIDNSVFNNSSSMSAAAIDVFLNRFSNSCISTNNGFRAIDPIGYNPTSGFQYGGYVTAGQVIADSAQVYGINPQVLLTTLEKEQSLVTGRNDYNGYCNNGDQHKYAAAVGYGCPDSGTRYSYSGLSLYQRNGVQFSDTGTTCVNSSSKAGFSQQVIRAAWLLKFGQQRSEGNVGWAVIKGNWNNSDDPQSCYSGPMTQGSRQRCPGGGVSYYDGYTTIDSTPVHMDNGATASLYWYTPHFHGNQNFFSIFTGWFGSTYYTPSQCDTGSNGVTCVWELMKTNGQHFFTTSTIERDNAVSNGLYYVGVAFYARPSNYQSSSSVVPTYRLQNNGEHFWTTSDQLRQQYLGSGWTSEGIAWYTDPDHSNTGTPVYKLSGPSNTYVYTYSAGYFDYINQGYAYAGETLNAPTKYIETLPTTASYSNVYRIRLCNNSYMLTTSVPELEAIIRDQCNRYEGVAFYATRNGGTAVNRLSNNGRYIWTISQAETTNLSNSGWAYEGVAFYANSSGSTPIYRLSSSIRHVWTTSLAELSTLSKAGWTYEGVAFYGYEGSSSIKAPINRLYASGRYSWTTSLFELSALSRGGWAYEGVGFYAYDQNVANSVPIYRLHYKGLYIWTTSNAEKASLTNAGWAYEGVGFYAYDQNVANSIPVYRLHSSGRYIWTTSNAEKASLTNAGWAYEGVGFYAAGP